MVLNNLTSDDKDFVYPKHFIHIINSYDESIKNFNELEAHKTTQNEFQNVCTNIRRFDKKNDTKTIRNETISIEEYATNENLVNPMTQHSYKVSYLGFIFSEKRIRISLREKRRNFIGLNIHPISFQGIKYSSDLIQSPENDCFIQHDSGTYSI